MASPFAVMGTLLRGYNARALRILVKNGLDRKQASAIASASINRTTWTGMLVPDRLFEAGVNPTAVEELDKAGLLTTKPTTIAIPYKSTKESIRIIRIPLKALSEDELSQRIGEKVRISCHLDIDADMTKQFTEIVKEGFFTHLWEQSLLSLDRISRSRDRMIFVLQSESTKQILGFVTGRYDNELPEHTYLLELVAVRNGHRGKGIGKALICALFKELESQKYKGYTEVALFCNKYDKHGIKLVDYYQKAGFVMAGLEGDLIKMVAPTAHTDLTVKKMIYNS